MTEIKKSQYRTLNHKERDMLFAFYEKWNGNALAMVRDAKCPFHSKNQIYFYRDEYNFEVQLVQIREKQAKDIINSLKDSKVLAIQQAIDMVKPKQRMLTMPITGEPILDKDGQPQFVTIYPSSKEIKTAWEIIKTELGEPTQISKGDITSGGKPINSNIITFSNFKKE